MSALRVVVSVTSTARTLLVPTLVAVTAAPHSTLMACTVMVSIHSYIHRARDIANPPLERWIRTECWSNLVQTLMSVLWTETTVWRCVSTLTALTTAPVTLATPSTLMESPAEVVFHMDEGRFA